MHRLVVTTIVGAALLVGVGCGGTAAAVGSSRSGISTITTKRDPGRGSVVGIVFFHNSAGHGVVSVFNATGRVVAHKKVSWSHSGFRFVLTAARYTLKLTPRRYWTAYACFPQKTVRVRASHTTHVKLGICEFS